MKRTFWGVMATLMILSLVVLPASAQTISPWTTGVDLQNLTDTATSYQLQFYKADGALHTPMRLRRIWRLVALLMSTSPT